MEEEIIIPEEEVFDYHELRYILDKDGYICHASLGAMIICDLGECTEYKGEVPEDYETIEEWYGGELEKLNAWKIVNGNLVFDNNKYNELQVLYKKQEKENAFTTHKYVDEKISGIVVENTNVRNLFDKNSLDNFKVALLNDTSDFEVEKLIIHTTTNEKFLNLIINNRNILYNELLTNKINDVNFTIETDKSINIDGTTTDNFEVDILGNKTNKNPYFILKKGFNYTLSGLDGLTLKMYYFDGIDRVEVYSGSDGIITFTDEDKKITNVTLLISGTIDKTIYPMLNLGSIPLEYIKSEYTKLQIELPEYNPLYPSENLVPSEDLTPKYGGNLIIKLEKGKIIVTDEKETEFSQILMPKTYYPDTTIHTLEDTTMDLIYVTSFSNGVTYDEVIKSINESPESITIKAEKINIDGVLSVLSESGSTIINGDNIKTGSVSADRVNGGTLTGASIDVYSGTGFFRYYPIQSIHPYVSSLNVASQGGTTGGISFRTSTSRSSTGNEGASLAYSSTSKNFLIATANGNNMNMNVRNNLGIDSSGYTRISSGNSSAAGSYVGSTYITANESITLSASSGAVYAAGNSLSSSRVTTANGSASSRNTKTNLVEFSGEYERALKLLNDMKLYSYDYKYDLYLKRHQYGFIIDEVEELDKEQEFFKIHNEEAIVTGEHLNFNTEDKKDTDEIIDVKMYDRDALDKYLLTVCKGLLNEINELKKEMEELKNGKNNI